MNQAKPLSGGTRVARTFWGKDVQCAEPLESRVLLNTAPEIEPFDDLVGAEGQAVELYAFYWDDGDPANMLGLVDWGDGTQDVVPVEQMSSFYVDLFHTYKDDGEYTASLSVIDEEGLTAVFQFKSRISNVAPTITIAAGPAVNEGDAYTIWFEAEDPGLDQIQAWRVDWGDGTVEDLAAEVRTASHTYLDGTAHYPVRVTATDEDGAFTATGPTVASGFGDLGRVTADLGIQASESTYALATQPDGKVLVAGSIGYNAQYWLARFNPDGSPDLTFGTAGSIRGSNGAFLAVAVQSDGSIVVVRRRGGTGQETFELQRFSSTGVPDPSFGVGGVRQLQYSSYRLAVQADDKIVVVGTTTAASPTFGLNVVVGRYTADGNPDTAFGSSGLATIDFGPVGGFQDGGHSVAILNDGRILVGGWTTSANYTIRGAVFAMLKTTGVLDPSFGSGGRVLHNGMDAPTDIGVLSDGRIAVAQNRGGLVFLKPNGAFEARRGAPLPHGGYGTRLIVQPTGQITVIGGAINQTSNQVAVRRFLPNGSLDPTFGADGTLAVLLSPLGRGSGGGVRAAGALKDGSIVIAGDAFSISGQLDIGLVRIHSSTRVRVNDVAPTVRATGNDHTNTAVPYILSLFVSDPGQDTVQSWRIDWGDGTIDTIAGTATFASHTFGGTGRNVLIRAWATNEDGTYAAAPLQVRIGPAAPSDLLATPATNTEISLAWTDNATDEWGFRVERSVDGANFEVIDTVPANTSTYTARNLSPGVRYYFRVQAYNSDSSPYSNIASSLPAVVPPAAPAQPSVTVLSSRQAELRWLDMSDNETGFEIEYSTDGLVYQFLAATFAGATYHFVNELTPGTTYHFRIRAFNSAGASEYTDPVTGSTPALDPPTGLFGVARSGSEIDLYWADNSSDETGFELEISSDGQNFSPLDSVPANQTYYRATNLIAGTTYYFRVRATGAAGHSAFSEPASATTSSAPAAPSNLTATPASNTEINLSWTDNSADETLFIIEISEDGVNFIEHDQVGANTTTWRIYGLTTGQRYYFRVRAFNGEHSPYSNVADAVPAALVPAAPVALRSTAQGGTWVDLAWSDVSDNETGFQVEYSLDGTNFLFGGEAYANQQTLRVNGLAPSTTYFFRVRAFNTAGFSGYSGTISASTTAELPAAPSDLVATAVANTQVRLQWVDNSVNEDGFIIEYGTDGINWSAEYVSAGTDTYLVQFLAAGTTYQFRVRAYNDAGFSGYSNTAAATTTTLSRPSNLVAVAPTTTRIELTWADNNTNEDGFIVEVSSDGAVYTELDRTGANTPYFTMYNATPGTLYFFRVRAFNGASTGAPSDPVSIRTPALDPPSYSYATVASSTRIDLSWGDASDGETGFEIEVSTDGQNFAYHSTAPANSYTAPVGGLTPGTLYFFRVRAVNGADASLYSPVAQATTTTVPAAPSGLVAIPASSTQINLAWVDNATNETQYEVELSTDGVNFTHDRFLGADATSASVYGLLPGVTYYFRVRALNGDPSDYSNTASATTRSNTPAAPNALSATALSSSAVRLVWADRSDNEDGFWIERSTDGVQFEQIDSVSAGSTSYDATGLAAGTAYWFRVRAYNSFGGSDYSNVATATTVAINAPSNLFAQMVSASRIELWWSDNSDNEAGFVLEFSSDGQNFAEVGRTGPNQTTLAASELSPGTTYSFRVRAFAGPSYSAYSAVVTATTTIPPAAPSGLDAVPASNTSIALTWTDNATNEQGFLIERSLDGITFTQAGLAGADATTFTAMNLTPGTLYYFRVRAYNGDPGPYSNVASARPATVLPAAPLNLTATAQSNRTIHLTWQDGGDNESGYRLEISTDGVNFEPLGTTGANGTFFAANLLLPETTYYFRAQAYNSAGSSAWGNTASATTLAMPIAPSNLAVSGVGETWVQLTWTDNSHNEHGFRIERRVGNGNWQTVQVVEPNQTAFLDTGLTADTQYSYRVWATHPQGDGGPSNAVTTRTTHQVPVIVEPASANPSIVTGTTTQLHTLGWVARGEQFLTYTWSVVSAPAGAPPVQFSRNSSNAAKDSTATFGQAGVYRFRVTVVNGNASNTSEVDVNVHATPTSVVVTPATVTLAFNATQLFSAVANDQFGQALAPQPQISWSIDPGGLGRISPTGLYTAPSSGNGVTTIRATAGSVSGTARVELGNRTVINFDELPDGTEVSTQYELVTFSATGGGTLRVFDDFSPNAIAVFPHPFTGGVTLTFAVPVSGIRFRTGWFDSNSGATVAQMRLFSGSTLLATLPLISPGGATVRLVDLGEYSNVTRLEIGDNNDPAGLAYDNFEFYLDFLDLVGHRAGVNAGQEVPESTEDTGDPSQYLVLVNDDYEEGDPEGRADLVNNTAALANGDYRRDADGNPIDDDLVRITLKQIPEGLQTGRIELLLSHPGAVRLFKPDGTQFYRAGETPESVLVLDLASPSGYLAGLRDGDLDIWLEAAVGVEDFTFSYLFRSSAGTELARDSVHMSLAQWQFTDADGRAILSAQTISLPALLEAARSGLGGFHENRGAYFRSVLTRIPIGTLLEMEVVSSEHPEDRYTDYLARDGTGRVYSLNPGVLYSSAGLYGASDDPIAASHERDEILSVLGVNIVHNQEAQATLKTGPAGQPVDVHKRSLHPTKFVTILMNTDTPTAGDTISVLGLNPTGEDWVWEAETSDGQTFSLTTPAPSFHFTVQARTAGDMVITVRGGPFRSPVEPHFGFENSSLVRVLPVGQPMDQWEQAAWNALRIDGRVGGVFGDAFLRNRRITELYAEMYNSNRAVFKWSGHAAFASALVGNAMAEAAWYRQVLPDAVEPGTIKQSYDALSVGNLAVYDDMYRQMLAYRDGGIAAIRALANANKIVPSQLQAWEDIDAGIAGGNQQLVWTGNEGLLRYEQQFTLQTRVYNVNPALWDRLTTYTTWVPRIPPMKSPVPGDPVTFNEYRSQDPNVPDNASIGNFAARWAWIINSQVPAWQAWSNANGPIDIERLLNNGY